MGFNNTYDTDVIIRQYGRFIESQNPGGWNFKVFSGSESFMPI